MDQEAPTTITVTGYDFATQTFECECDALETATPPVAEPSAPQASPNAALAKPRRVK